MTLSTHLGAQRRPLTGVRDPLRLEAVAQAELSGHLDDQGLNAVVATLALACRVPIAVVNIVTGDQQTYAAEIGVGAPCTSVPDGLSFCAEVVETGRSLSVADAAMHPVYAQNPMVLGGAIGAYAGVPLIDNGVVLGSVSIFDDRPRHFTDHELSILQHQTQLASAVLALRRSSRTDVLTGLPNRRLFIERLEGSLDRLNRRPGSVAVVYLDVDDFKGINDTYGHAVGDMVLVELSTRLLTVMRSTDTVARLGGDEFAAVCEDLSGDEPADVLALRILDACSEPWLLNGLSLQVKVSVGVALTHEAVGPDLLLHDADQAMYRFKGVAR